MRKGFFVFSLAMILAIGAMTVFSPGPALAADKLLVCAVCDKSFYETAVKVVTEMNLADKVTVKKSSCLGACSVPPVIEFKGELYTSMTEEKLKILLGKTYGQGHL
jgi:(2Fe-2S) ferredoxin